MIESRPHKLGRDIAKNILTTGDLFYQANRKASFFRGLIHGLLRHKWIIQIIMENRDFRDGLYKELLDELRED